MQSSYISEICVPHLNTNITSFSPANFELIIPKLSLSNLANVQALEITLASNLQRPINSEISDLKRSQEFCNA